MPNSWNSGYSNSGSYYNNPASQRGGRGRPFNNRDRSYGHESENEKRKRSFVIIGLRQLQGTVSERESRDEDRNAAIDIVRYLGITDAIPPMNVKRARNGPVLIVTLESIQSRDLILRRSHFLNAIEATRNLKLEKAYTAEDMVNRYGRLPNDHDLDNPHSDVNINRFGRINNERHIQYDRHNDQHRSNDYSGGYHNNQGRTNSRNNDFHSYANNDGYDERGNNHRGRGYSRNDDNNYSNDLGATNRGGTYRSGNRNGTDSRNNYDNHYHGYNNDNSNRRYNNNDSYQNANDRDFRRNNTIRGNPRGNYTFR
uniref:GATA zinc finger domain-containing protein 14-like n=1 Tax=Panagrolaimus davidi TaxID=227884 RepID=A0A914Q6P2_9BILA